MVISKWQISLPFHTPQLIKFYSFIYLKKGPGNEVDVGSTPGVGGEGGLSSLPGLYHQRSCLLYVFGKKRKEKDREKGCDYKVKSRFKESGLRNSKPFKYTYAMRIVSFSKLIYIITP